MVLEEEVANSLRVRAASERMSVSKFVATKIEQLLQSDSAYEEAMNAFLTSSPYLDSQGQRYPKREELYE